MKTPCMVERLHVPWLSELLCLPEGPRELDWFLRLQERTQLGNTINTSNSNWWAVMVCMAWISVGVWQKQKAPLLIMVCEQLLERRNISPADESAVKVIPRFSGISGGWIPAIPQLSEQGWVQTHTPLSQTDACKSDREGKINTMLTELTSMKLLLISTHVPRRRIKTCTLNLFHNVMVL